MGDSELYRAIQASLKTSTNSTSDSGSRRTSPSPPRAKVKSAASRNAGRAAALRTSGSRNVLASTHPKVRIPKRLWQHDREEVILRCADRVAPRSLTVDTPTTAFRRSLTAPGVLDFLRAVNFFPRDDRRGVLALAHYDPAVFYLGIAALER